MKICKSDRHQEIAWENATLHESCPICVKLAAIEAIHEAQEEALRDEIEDLENEVTQLEGKSKDLKAGASW